MGKIICVWGNSGSGKTTFSTLLAQQSAQQNLQTLIVSPDSELPMHPVLFPTAKANPDQSLGNLVFSEKTIPAIIAEHIVISPHSPQVGLLAYTAGDHPLSYPAPSFEYAKSLFLTLAAICDRVIIDCCSQVNNTFTAAAIEIADVVVRVVTGDLRGVAYMQSQRQLLADKRYHFEDQLTMIGQLQPYAPLDNIAHLIGRIDGVLPYNNDIVRLSHEGGVFDLRVAKGKYQQALTVVEGAIANVAQYQ